MDRVGGGGERPRRLRGAARFRGTYEGPLETFFINPEYERAGITSTVTGLAPVRLVVVDEGGEATVTLTLSTAQVTCTGRGPRTESAAYAGMGHVAVAGASCSFASTGTSRTCAMRAAVLNVDASSGQAYVELSGVAPIAETPDCTSWAPRALSISDAARFINGVP